MGKVAKYLNQLTIGNVFDTPDVLEAYAVDCSALKIKPKLVAFPESTEDIRKIMRFCYQLAQKGIKIPVTVRGSGLDEMGADLTNSLLVSTEKLNRLLEADKRERLVRVQAGITLKELNTALSINGLTIPVGGHESDTIGGIISNCPSDDFAGKYGGIMNYVERIEVVLANGDVLQTNRLPGRMVSKKAKEKSLEGTIYRKLSEITKANKPLIDDIHTNNTGSAGYPTIAQVKRGNSLDIAPLFFGAQGTLGVITEVILRAVPVKSGARRVVATFEEFDVAQKFLDLANSLKPKELNVYDIKIIKTAEESGKRLSEITKKLEKGYVVFAKFDGKPGSAIRKIMSVRKVLPSSTQLIVEDNKNTAKLDEFENSLANFLNSTRTGERVPLMTDFYMPSSRLSRFIADLGLLEKSLKLDLAIYGSYAASNYNLRPRFKISDKDFGKKAVAFLRAGTYIINHEGGSITGGNPEGRVKALVTNDAMLENEKNLYNAIKDLFDKHGLLNPGVKLGADNKFTITHFRDSSSSKIIV
ncbi:FAD-binding oxidoreductase [Candidatus Saccharibacteria bacterium]|nr:FAD-binding oxidoreductase [Candidatus Saccharibacteria bacterium]MBR0423944.1 FAD-binding oxidoreductase [Candidatus Saccharibacteria bacterium]